MALDDVYTQAPWTPYSGVQQRMDQGMSQLAQVPERNAQLRAQQAALEAQQQANANAKYTAPGNEASPYRKSLASSIMQMVPGYTPEFEARFTAERQAAQAQPVPQAPGQAVTGLGLGQQGPIALRQPPVNQGWAPAQPRPSGDETNYLGQPATPSGLSSRGPDAPGLPGYSSPGMDMTGMQVPPQVRLSPQVNVTQTQPQAQTNLDVDTAMHMAPFLKANKDDPRVLINDRNLALKREQLAQREASQARADKTKRDLAAALLRLREKLGDTERKALIEQAKIHAANYRAELMAIAKQTSGLGGIVYDQQTTDAMQRENQGVIDQLDQLDQVEKKLNAEPTTPLKKVERSVTIKGPVTITNGSQEQTGPDGPELEAWLKANPSWSRK